MRAALLLIATVTIPLGACSGMNGMGSNSNPGTRAIVGDFGEATLQDASGARIGSAKMTQGPTGLLIRIEATGLTPGWHGVHIHSVGECTAPFTGAGGHINHTQPATPHGLLNAQGPDDGDLPNIWADAQGRVNAEVFTTRARIANQGPGEWLWDADGSALIVHARPDDHTSQPIGGAGDRVACGVMAAG